MLKNLRNGATTSCGCVRKERVKETHKKYNTYDLTGEYGIGYDCNGKEFYFDIEDFGKIKDYYWLVSNGYVVTNARDTKKTISMHRLVMNASEGTEIDHILHQTNDNRKSQLREITHSQNCINRRIKSTNTSGVTGVCWHKANNKWQARITVNGKRINLGLFDDLEDAIEARLKAELEIFGEYSPNYQKLSQNESNQQPSEQQNTQ